jgi:hypothetical protein
MIPNRVGVDVIYKNPLAKISPYSIGQTTPNTQSGGVSDDRLS